MPCEHDGGYEPCFEVRCPCKGCDGYLILDGINRHRTKAFVLCTECNCCHVIGVPLIDREAVTTERDARPPLGEGD